MRDACIPATFCTGVGERVVSSTKEFASLLATGVVAIAKICVDVGIGVGFCVGKGVDEDLGVGVDGSVGVAVGGIGVGVGITIWTVTELASASDAVVDPPPVYLLKRILYVPDPSYSERLGLPILPCIVPVHWPLTIGTDK